MIDKKIEDFLQKADMNYMFCLLSKLEAGRLSQLPAYVRDKFGKKVSVVAMEHVADNEVPDYLNDIEEAAFAMSQSRIANEEDDESESDLREVSETLSVLPPDPEPEPRNPFGDDDEDLDMDDYEDEYEDEDEDDDEEE
ncbi:MAG TPA: hypothetical protein PL126_07135 [Candidatus Cloacimonadota bacterium]|nr:hypothetical protein [Candidatus Cloacimonadota bacterium]